MQLVKDYRHVFRGYHSDGGICHVRVYAEEGKTPVFLVTELPTNDNSSITNMAEYVAPDVVCAYDAHLFEQGTPEPFIWIEHYPPLGRSRHDGDYDRVTFKDYRLRFSDRHVERGKRRLCIGDPEWHHLTRDEVAALIGSPVLDDTDVEGRS